MLPFDFNQELKDSAQDVKEIWKFIYKFTIF